MIKNLSLSFAIGITALSCVVLSPYPFYNNNDFINQKLIGSWVPVDDDEITYTISKLDSVSYTICIKNDDEKKVYNYIARYLKIENSEYVDLVTLLSESDQEDLFDQFIFPMHALFKLETTDSTIIVKTINDDWCKGYRDKNRKQCKINYYIDNAYLVLTDSTDLLRKFIKNNDRKTIYFNNNKTELMFEDFSLLKRIK